MQLPGHVGQALVSCLIWMAVRGLMLAYVTDHSLHTCECARDPPACGVIGDCNCEDHPFPTPWHPKSPATVRRARMTIWYTSALNVALLLNNSEVRHLSLVKCSSAGGKAAPNDYFTMRRLERLTVSYPFCLACQNHDVVLRRDAGVAFQEEIRVAIIHTSILIEKPTMKSYTVQAHVGSDGVLPFPSLRISQAGLPKDSRMSVTFLY